MKTKLQAKKREQCIEVSNCRFQKRAVGTRTRKQFGILRLQENRAYTGRKAVRA